MPGRIESAARAKRGRKLNDRELAAVLAGLRFLQAAPDIPYSIEPILTDGGTLRRLNDREITALCERLNRGEVG